jgi:hypothetical protein
MAGTMRRAISSTIAVACAVAALAQPSVALPRPLAALLAGRPGRVSPGPSPSVVASSSEAASMQARLSVLLDGIVGPGHATVTVNAIPDRNRLSKQSLRYARAGVATQRQSARTRAGGYSARSTTWCTAQPLQTPRSRPAGSATSTWG